MLKICGFLCLFLAFLANHVLCQGSGNDGKLRVCIVEGRGTYRRAGKFCPVLDKEKSGIECVLGTDRLDCLRRMGKGTVDFGVFSPEDLLAAQWADLDVLVTNELRSRDREFESSIVAVINRKIISDESPSVESVLRNRTLCHPGTGNTKNRGLTDTLVKYLESLVTLRSCDPNLSLEENSIRSLADFFGKACKAGPWVLDPHRDEKLKAKYKSLCAACESWRCMESDRYWGGTGALTCLTDGAGDVLWSHLDDVKMYFGFNGGLPFGRPDEFAYLCRDGTRQNLTDNAEPCVWLNRPWPIVVTKRKSAEAVSRIALSLTNTSVTSNDWRGALAALLEVRAPPPPLQPPRAPLDHLDRARGYREAYSQSGCSPPRHISVCTSTTAEKSKCDWLSEAAAVYGVVPPLQCVLNVSVRDCMQAVKMGDADVTVARSDWLFAAQRNYSLSPLLFEVTPILEQLNTVVPYVRDGAKLLKMADLRGKRASFPQYNGVAWHSVIRYLMAYKEMKSCNINHVADYFGESCAPGLEDEIVENEIKEKLTKTCEKQSGKILNGEYAALKSLVEDKSDVAFLSMQTFKEYTAKQIPLPWAKASNIEIVPICPEGIRYCILHWSSLGQVYASGNITSMRKQEIINVFKKLDQLFGLYYPFHTAMFALYGPYNHQFDVIFHNNTRLLATYDQLSDMHPYDKIPYNFEKGFFNYTLDSCHTNGCKMASSSRIFFVLSFLVVFKFLYLL